MADENVQDENIKPWDTGFDESKTEKMMKQYMAKYRANKDALQDYLGGFNKIEGSDVAKATNIFGSDISGNKGLTAGVLGFLSGLGGKFDRDTSKEDIASAKADSKKFSQENILRNGFSKKVATDDQTLKYTEGLVTALKGGNGIQDIQAIYGFLKAIDPASVVRPGEIDLMSSANPLLGQLSKIVGSWTEGTQLTATVRRQMANAVIQYAANAKKSRASAEEEYLRYANNYGLNPENIVFAPSVEPPLTYNQAIAEALRDGAAKNAKQEKDIKKKLSAKDEKEAAADDAKAKADAQAKGGM